MMLSCKLVVDEYVWPLAFSCFIIFSGAFLNDCVFKLPTFNCFSRFLPNFQALILIVSVVVSLW